MEGVVELAGLHAPPVFGGYVCWGVHVCADGSGWKLGLVQVYFLNMG